MIIYCRSQYIINKKKEKLIETFAVDMVATNMFFFFFWKNKIYVFLYPTHDILLSVFNFYIDHVYAQEQQSNLKKKLIHIPF